MKDLALGCGYMIVGTIIIYIVLFHFLGLFTTGWLTLGSFGIFVFYAGLNWLREH